MKIKKFFQYLFKKTFQLIFLGFYGNIKFPPADKDSKIGKHKIKRIKIGNQNFKVDKNIYEVKNGRIYTDLVENVAIIKNNYLLPKISYQQINGVLKNEKYNKVLIDGTNRIKKKIKGNILSLVQGASGNNYFHFLFDIVPKIILIQQANLLKEIDFFYLPSNLNWQYKILLTFGITRKKILDSNKFRHIEADKIYAVEHPWYTKGKVQEEINNIPSWIIFSLRKKFLKNYKKQKNVKKIFIDRSDSIFNHCKLVNNEEIKDFLFKNNFKSYQVSKLDFFEQISLFHNAKVIIGPHGAAFTNIIFSKPGLRLIELIPKNHGSLKCKKISKLLKFNYKRIELKRLINQNENINGDMKISISFLKKVLKKFL
tara:strand:+ start:1546 stop:2655 length:1110 start_codon:yes stop_codon:yes gene_type:complete